MTDKEYWYISYTTKRRDNFSIDYWTEVKKGNIADIILKYEKMSRTDTYYTDFRIIFYSELSARQYKKLEGNIG